MAHGRAYTRCVVVNFVRLVLANLCLISLLLSETHICMAGSNPGGASTPAGVGMEAIEEVGVSEARPLPLHPLVRIRPNVVDERLVWEIRVKGDVAMRVRTRYGGLGLKERAEIIAWRLSAVLDSGTEELFLPGKRNGETVVMCGERLIATVDRQSAMLNASTSEALAWVWCDNLNTLLDRIHDRMNAPRAGRIAEVSRGCSRDSSRDGWTIVRTFQGIASWYGPGFHGKETASGETYNQWDLTAAHATLPFGTRVLVTSLDTNKSVVVRVNDRGPWVKGRIIDLSRKAAQEIGLLDSGIGRVRLDVLE